MARYTENEKAVALALIAACNATDKAIDTFGYESKAADTLRADEVTLRRRLYLLMGVESIPEKMTADWQFSLPQASRIVGILGWARRNWRKASA